MNEWNTVQEETAAAASLLKRDGGDGAELRGHVPAEPRGVVLLLHGGAENGRSVVGWWTLAVLRMVPFALAITRRSGDQLAVVRLKYRVRGWNGRRQDPLLDARWALDRVRRALPGRPIALVGHSMGGRVALHLGGDPDVVAVAALAPWVESDLRRPRPGTRVLLVHGSHDRVTDPRRTGILATRLAQEGVDVQHVSVDGGDHPMVRRASRWHDTVADFVTDALLPRGRTS
jgi:alpha-beta hydrolase superfamily lysophospholipase